MQCAASAMRSIDLRQWCVCLRRVCNHLGSLTHDDDFDGDDDDGDDDDDDHHHHHTDDNVTMLR